MANIGSLLCLVVLIYSILGVYLFADIKHNGPLSSDSNFMNLGNAFLLLIRVATGEDWPKVMEALSKKVGFNYECKTSPTYYDY